MNASEELPLIAGISLMGLAPISEVAPATWASLLTVLMVGLSIAFALQVLLFCLGSAIALSVIKLPRLRSAQAQRLTSPSSDLKIGTIAGLGILSTINLVLFIASFLATAFAHFQSPITGAIAGVVLWAFYLGLMLWLSFVTVNSLAEGLLNFVTLGLRRITSTVLSLFKNQKDEQKWMHEQIETAIHEEVQTALNTLEQALIQQQSPLTLSTAPTPMASLGVEDLAPENQQQLDEFASTMQLAWEELGSYINQADAKKLSPKKLDRTLEKIFKELPHELSIDASTLSALMKELTEVLSQRQDLSDKKKTRIIEQIQTTWNSFTTASSSENDMLETEELDFAKASDSGANVNSEADSQSPSFSLSDAIHLQSMIGDAIAPILSKLSAEDMGQSLEQFLADNQFDLTSLNHTIEEQALQIRDRTTEQITSIQQALQQGTQKRLEAIQQDLQNRLESTRKTVSTAVWWLFATILTCGLSAAFAGAISTRLYPIP